MRNFRKHVTILSIIASGLLLLNLIGLFLSLSFTARGDDRLFPGIRYERSSELIIERAGKEVRFARQDEDDWVLASGDVPLPIPSSRIRTFLSVVSELVPFRHVTDDPALFDRFGLGGEGAGRLRIRDARGRTLADLTAGDLSADGTGLYIRTGRSGSVVLVSSELVSYLRREAGYWVRLRLFPEEVLPERIIRIQAEADVPGENERSFVLARVEERDMTAWSLVGGDEGILDQGTVEAYVATVAGAEASGVLSREREADMTLRAAGSLIMLTDRNRSYRIDFLVADRAEATYAARIDGFLYRISRETFDLLLPPRGNLMREEVRR